MLFFNAELFVQLGGCSPEFSIFFKAAGGFFYYGKSFRENFFKDLLYLLIAVLFQLVNFLVECVFTVYITEWQVFCLAVNVFYFFIYLAEVLADLLTEFLR